MLYKHLRLLYISVLHPKVHQNAVVISLVQSFPLTPLVYIGFSKSLGLETLGIIGIQ